MKVVDAERAGLGCAGLGDDVGDALLRVLLPGHGRVVDRMTALVTSANLTQRASGDNLEAGVLIRGDDTARRIVEHIEELRGTGTLRPA